MFDPETIKTTPIEELKEELDRYSPPPPEIDKVSILLKVLRECKSRGYHVAAFGGYGLDGLYGKLTRSHHDGDLVCGIGEEKSVCQVLTDLGFKPVPVGNGEKWEISNPVFGEFDIELGPLSRFTQLTKLPESEFIPDEGNAVLLGHKFRAVTHIGQKAVVNSSVKLEIPEGFGPYPEDKIKNREMIFRILASQPHQ